MENHTTAMTKTKSTKKNVWFGKIETKEEALKVIRESSTGFYFLAAAQIVLGYLVFGSTAIVDGVAFGVSAFLLRQFRSRIVASLMLLLTVASVMMTATNLFGVGTGGRNILLAFVMVWASIRAIQATFKLHKLEKNESATPSLA